MRIYTRVVIDNATGQIEESDSYEYAGPIALCGGGKGGKKQTVKQTSEPWKGAQPYLYDVFARAQGQANQGAYGGPFIGTQSPYTQQAINQQAAMAGDPNSLISMGQRELGDTISGKYLSIDGNPAAQAAINAATRTVSKQFSGDNYGSSANREWLGRGVGEAVSPILLQERQNQLAAIQAAPGLQMANTNLLYGAGAAQDARSQAEADAERARYEASWDPITRYSQIINGTAALGGQSGSTQQPIYSNPLSSALGLGIGGLSLYNGLGAAGLLGGGAAALAPAMTGAGFGLNAVGLAGMLGASDRRLKSNIKRVGTHRLGIGIYSYDIGGMHQIGVMADEVERVMPHAVREVAGYKFVAYGRL